MSELILLLLALPTVVLAACWFGSSLLSRSAAPLRAAAPQTAAQPANRPRCPSLTVLAASASLPHGATIAEVAAAVAADDVQTELDRELVDDRGLPVMAARSDDAVDIALQEEVDAWLSSVDVKVHFDPEQWRALTLATTVVRELSVHARSLLQLPNTAHSTLELIPLLPTDWHDGQRSAIAKWLGHAFLQFGWPAAQFQISDVSTVETSRAIMRVLEEPASNKDFSIALVVACSSNIGQRTVDQWASRATLFTATQADGDVPGEGSAGLLVTTLPPASVASLPVSSLYLGKRIDRLPLKPGKAGPSQMAEITKETLDRVQVHADEIAMVLADTSAHSKRMFELMNFASTSMEHLDGSTDVVRVGAITGASDAVPFIAALGLAHHYTLENKEPILVISNADSDCISASVIRPADDPVSPVGTSSDAERQEKEITHA